MRQTVEPKNRLGKSSLAVCIILIATTAALSGCGGSGTASPSTESEGEAIAAAPDAATARRAEAICRRGVAEAGALTARLAQVMSHATSPEQGLNEGLVRPGIGILEHEAAAFAALRPQPESAAFSTYVGLFEPVLSLAYQRLAVGEAVEDGSSHELEDLIESLTTEQAKLAASLGLTACETDFFEALGTAQ